MNEVTIATIVSQATGKAAEIVLEQLRSERATSTKLARADRGDEKSEFGDNDSEFSDGEGIANNCEICWQLWKNCWLHLQPLVTCQFPEQTLSESWLNKQHKLLVWWEFKRNNYWDDWFHEINVAHNIRDIILPQQNRHSLLQEVPDQDIEGFNPRNKSFILNGISFVRGSLVSALFCTCVQYCSTDLLYMCSTKKNRTMGTGRGTHHGHCKGNSFTGTLRTKALRARICCTKQVAPGPCIARAPELVLPDLWLNKQHKSSLVC